MIFSALARRSACFTSVNAHPGVTVDLEHHQHLGLVSLVELFALLSDEVLNIIKLLECVIELDLWFFAVERL